MTRALVQGGRPQTEIFPEDAKETGRELGLVDGAIVVGEYRSTRSGGVSSPDWVYGQAVRGRIDPARQGSGPGTVQLGQIDESTTHVITVDADVLVSTKDRLRTTADDREWAITGAQVRTEALVKRVEVKQV